MGKKTLLPPPTDEADPQLRRFRPGRDLPPFLIAALILSYVLAGRDWDGILRAMKQTNLPLFLLGAGVFTLGHFLLNVISFRLLFNWFLARGSMREMVKVYGASLVPQVLLNSLGQLTLYLYMIRRKHLPVLPVLGLSLFYIYGDTGAMVIVVGLALALHPSVYPLIPLGWALVAVGLLAGMWFFPLGGGERLWRRLYCLPLFLALRAGRARHYFSFIAIRLCFPLFQLTGHLLALSAMGMKVPLSSLFLIVTGMTFTTFLPVSALGFGAPNLVALYLAPYAPQAELAEETAVAYGLLFQTAFLLGRFFLGLPFALPFWREIIRPAETEASQTAGKELLSAACGKEPGKEAGQDERGEGRWSM